MIATFLTQFGDYNVRIGDTDVAALKRLQQRCPVETMLVDASDPGQLAAAMIGMQAVLSALTFRLNPLVARAALQAGISYFDLTEDVETTAAVRDLALQCAAGPDFHAAMRPGPGICRNCGEPSGSTL